VIYFLAGAALFLGIVWSILWFTAYLHKRNSEYYQAADMFQAILTGAAILVAGYWYLVERRGTAHADISQSLTIAPAEEGYAIVESAVKMHNLGSTLLKIRKIDVRLQQASPTGLPLKEMADAGYKDWPKQFKDKTPMYNGTELQWPLLKSFMGDVRYDIEPDESDTATTTFVVSCDIKEIRVAAEVNKANSSLWWKTRTFASLEKACEKPGKDPKATDLAAQSDRQESSE
jgi:hypothetical protein